MTVERCCGSDVMPIRLKMIHAVATTIKHIEYANKSVLQ